MALKNRRSKSINSKIIISFTVIMIITVSSIRFFMSMYFQSSFRKYVDDSNRVEVDHLIKFDLKSIYSNNKWNMEEIKELGIDAIRKGIALIVYDGNGKEVWNVFEDEKVLLDTTLSKISNNMQNIDNRWKDNFEEYKVDVNSEDGIKAGYAYIGHYESTYYMENDIELYKSINKTVFVIGISSLLGIIIVSIVISNSISKPISKISTMTKFIGEGNYYKELDYKSNIREVDELIGSINSLTFALREQEELRKRLTGDIAHELRTPLTTIKGHLDVIIAGIWEPTNERLVSINQEVSRISQLVEDLRDLSKYDREKSKLNLERINLRGVIQGIVCNFQGKALERNIRIISDVNAVDVVVDKEKITQVIVNLLSNAIKYNRDNGKIIIKNYRENGMAVISIRDTGIGISKKDQRFIFERFYRVDKSRSRKIEGMGVGLTIAKSILNAHGGRITVRSKLGIGSEFIIILPIE